MLAELLHLTRNLEAQGIPLVSVHKDFGKPGLSGNTNLKAVLDPQGRITRLALLSPEEQPGLWTLKHGKKNFFPAVRLPACPLSLGIDDERWSPIQKARIEALRLLVGQSGRPPIQSVDLRSLWSKQAARILNWTAISAEPLIDTLRAFALAFDRFSTSAENVSNELLRAVEEALKHAAEAEFVQALGTLLVGERKQAKGKQATIEYKIQLFLDFAPLGDLGFSLYSPRVRQVVLDCLNREGPTDSSQSAFMDGHRVRCAMSGQMLSIADVLDEPFPEWSVAPTISRPTAPFSKFSAAPCNFRYARADSQAIPIGTNTANRLVAGLQTFTNRFKDSAWRAIRNGQLEERGNKKTEGRDVLIAYPSCTLEELAAVDLFAPKHYLQTPQEEHLAIKNFKDAAEPICLAFVAAVERESIDPCLTILLIRQVSTGQIQLAYSSTPTLNQFVSAVQDWIVSGGNLPMGLLIPLPSKKSATGFSWMPPALLFPEQIARLLSHQWIRGGAESARVAAPPVGMVLDLFLRKPGVWQGVAEQLLGITLTRTNALLVNAGHLLHKDNRRSLVEWRKFVNSAKSTRDPRSPDYALAQTLSLIGSLLFAMNSTANTYMNESAYLVGKLLAMMDELHKCYCEVVRDGDIPNSLIGNGLLGRASESPARALEELSERSRIYIGWARSAAIDPKRPDGIRIAIFSARKLLRLAQPLCETLHADEALAKELTPVQKAHLFLGYLSPVLGKDDKQDADGGNFPDSTTAP
jgi:hypothetical protein